MNYYIASCVFTRGFPELSFKIQNWVRSLGGIEIVSGKEKELMEI